MRRNFLTKQGTTMQIKLKSRRVQCKMHYLHEAPVNSQIYVMDILVLFIYLKFIGYNLFSKMLHTEKRRHSRIIKLFDNQNKNIQKTIGNCTKTEEFTLFGSKEGT
jgi:hypothetical protein